VAIICAIGFGRYQWVAVYTVLGVVLTLVGSSAYGEGSKTLTLSGSGATFPSPLYFKWFDSYRKLHPDINIYYQSIGSGGGIREITQGTTDFGATDTPMTDEQLKTFREKRGGNILHFPTVLGGIVPIYNLPGVDGEIKFTGKALAGIYLGTITKWNDPAIQDVNKGLKLPANDIVVVHRSMGSGSTFIWTDYLSKVSPEWKKKVGVGTTVKWPIGVGSKVNPDLVDVVKGTPSSIGYVELTYAIANKLPYGAVQNAAGKFIKADVKSLTAAAGTAKDMVEDFRASITDAPGDQAYPITSFTWLLVPEYLEDALKRKAVLDFLNWMLDHGQPMAEALGYAPLPKAVMEREKKALVFCHV